MPLSSWNTLWVCLVMFSPPQSADRPPSPLTVEQAQAEFQLPEGLVIERAVAEPQVVDPVAIRFDERGRMWVVEMRDYPHGPPAGQPPQSRIKILEDRDGDGHYEQQTVFADRLLFATGLQPWRDGAIVTMAGQIALLRDTDDDGRADQHVVWYQGFAEENSQLRANHPRLGLDQYIYVANGLRGGVVRDVRDPEMAPIELRGMDFRFDPLTGVAEAASGVAQFGLCFDDFGNRFVCSNRNPVRHIVIEDRYVRLNPSAGVANVIHDVAAWGEDSRLFPISQTWTTSTLHANQFTAACGLLVYRGSGLPPAYYGNALVCDPTGNLVHREVMQSQAATFVSRPAREGAEFLATRDTWFRPVNLELGPDGHLYVVDMYRAVIEHPQFMPEELKNRPDLRDGDRLGRIWRIRAESAGSAIPMPTNLASLSMDELVQLLQHPNAWQRETAARLLSQQENPAPSRPLLQMAQQGESAAARVQALWLLQTLGGLNDDTLAQALRDPHPQVRRQAVAILEERPADWQQHRRQILALASDPDPQVRFQVALFLSVDSMPSLEALTSIALLGAEDPFTRGAVRLAAKKERIGQLTSRVLQALLQPAPRTPGQIALATELVEQVASSSPPAEASRLLQTVLQASDPMLLELRCQVAAQMAGTLARKGQSWQKLLSESSSDWQPLLAAARTAAADQQAALSARRAAIALLAFDTHSVSTLLPLALDDHSLAIRQQAIAALTRNGDAATWEALIDQFAGQGPAIRNAVLDALLSHAVGTERLLTAVEAKKIHATEIDRVRADRLLKHRDTAVRERAGGLLAAGVSTDREQVLKDYRDCLTLDADPRRGREVFERNCATCHRIGDLGVNVAPDIADSRTKTPEQILTDILQPNRAIDSNYVSYTVATIDGLTFAGILAEETSAAVTLKQPDAKTITLRRSEIELMRSDGISFMPEGLEKNISQQQMADLVSFIKNWRYLDGQVPVGGAPSR